MTLIFFTIKIKGISTKYNINVVDRNHYKPLNGNI